MTKSIGNSKTQSLREFRLKRLASKRQRLVAQCKSLGISAHMGESRQPGMNPKTHKKYGRKKPTTIGKMRLWIKEAGKTPCN